MMTLSFGRSTHPSLGYVLSNILGVLISSCLWVSAPVQAKNADDATVDSIIESMEKSGKLDAAVDRAIERYTKKRQEEQMKAQAEAEKKSREMAKNAKKVNPKTEHLRGDPKANISLIVYSDFECPFCKRFHNTPAEVLKKYDGKVNWVYRHFPLSFHNPMATQEAIASECVAKLAGNDAFWTFTDAVYENTATNGQGLPPDQSIEVLAGKAGVKDMGKFRDCTKDEKMAKIVTEQTEDGAKSGITGTPGTVVRNNKTGKSELVVGALPVDALIQAVEKVMK